MQERIYLRTFGCQMNERDSEEVLGMLTAQGDALAEHPEQADVILLNTCSVLEHAEERALGEDGKRGRRVDRGTLVMLVFLVNRN